MTDCLVCVLPSITLSALPLLIDGLGWSTLMLQGSRDVSGYFADTTECLGCQLSVKMISHSNYPDAREKKIQCL